MSTSVPDLRGEWERGVALGSRGRYADAWAALTGVVTHVESGSPDEWIRSLAMSTAGSLHRQLGRHAAARDLDRSALALFHTSPAHPDWVEATLDAVLGLAADAIGHANADEAATWLDRADQILAYAAEPQPWRASIRLHWVRAELALLQDRPEHAEGAAATAVTLAERAASARHLAKSRLIHGVASAATDPTAAAAVLRSSLALSVPAGWRPLQWPAYLVLADLEADPRYLSAAGLVIRSIAADTPAPIAAEWLQRAEVRRCLAAPDV